MVMAPVSTALSAQKIASKNEFTSHTVTNPSTSMYDWVQRYSMNNGFSIIAMTSAYIHIRPSGYTEWDDLALLITPDNTVHIFDPSFTEDKLVSNPNLEIIPVEFRNLILSYGITCINLILRSKLKGLT